MTIDQDISKLTEEAETLIQEKVTHIRKIERCNQEKVINAFRANKVSDAHFHGTTGYGYDDAGRDTLEALYAEIFRAEDALVRPQIISGTHAITLALTGVLRPGDELLYITGDPYDTLHQVIGITGEASGSLKEFGITYNNVDLNEDGEIDIDAVQEAINDRTKMVAIQRSCGYDARPSITVRKIEEAIMAVKSAKPDAVVFVDNCYGEFVEAQEPVEAGADLCAGSLIKNPGGGLAKSGGYIAGKAELIEACAARLTAPGLGKEVGPTYPSLFDYFQGLFLAPHIVSEAHQGAVFTAALLTLAGFSPDPGWEEERTDLVQAVEFGGPEQMTAFCQAIQAFSPVNAFALPYADEMPGYDSPVIMAAGTFVQGASLELTADGPIRPPYRAYIQGGLTANHVRYAVTQALSRLYASKMI